MSYFFDVYGPYEIDRDERKIKRAGQSMWDYAEEQAEGLAKAWGCYVFCIENRHNIIPYYVGKTIAEGGFRNEVFHPHKIKKYNTLADFNGRRTMLLFPLISNDHGRFRKPASHSHAIDWLERLLIKTALHRNPDLLNVKDTMLQRKVTVRGVIGEKAKGRPYQEVQYARRALGIG